MILSVAEYCKDILTKGKCCQLPFHNLQHTKEVVNKVKIIGDTLDLSSEEIETIQIAAWFHDTGFNKVYNGHEDVSIELAHAFLSERNYHSDNLETVISCIEATKMPQNPSNIYAEVLSDADIYHISNCTFFYRKLLLRREWELEFEKYSTDLEWHQLNLKFLQKHKFFTNFGKEVLMKGKKENEAKVRNLIGFYL